MDDETIPDSLPESESSANTILLSALRMKLKDPTIPRLTWQLSQHHSEPEHDNSVLSGYHSDSSATFCSAFESNNDKEPGYLTLAPEGNNPLGNQESSNNQDDDHTVHKFSSLIEIDTEVRVDNAKQPRALQMIEDDPMLICNGVNKNDHNLIPLDGNEDSFSNSPIFSENNGDWNHFINSILNDEDINNISLKNAGTVNNGNIPIRINSEHVAPTNLMTENPILDMLSLNNAQLSPGVIHSESVTYKPDSVNMSIDIFANLSLNMEVKDCDAKDTLDEFDQNGIANKNAQPPTDDEIVEMGKSLFQNLNIVSTDGTSESSPEFTAPQKLSSCKNNSKHKKKDKNKLCNKHEGRFRVQVLSSNTREKEKQDSTTKIKEFGGEKGKGKIRKNQGKFPKSGKILDGCQKKINNQRKNKSKAESLQERIHDPRKQTGRNKYQICSPIRRMTRMQTGSLPAVSPSSSTTSIQSRTISRRPMNMKSRIRDRMSDIQQEVRAWLCGWGPPLDKARARKLIAEVQGTQKKIVSPPQSSNCIIFKLHEVEEISQVSEKLVLQLQSALAESDMQEQCVTNVSLGCKPCCCSSEHSDTESDAIETFSQSSDYSEVMRSEEDPSAALRQRVCFQKLTLADNKSDGENPTSDISNSQNSDSEFPGIPYLNNSESQGLQTNSNTYLEDANVSLHTSPASNCRATQKIITDSLDTTNPREAKTFSNAKEKMTHVNKTKFAPSKRDPRLQSASYARHLFKTKPTYECETVTQSSTYFSNGPRSSKQIKSAPHATVQTEPIVQAEKHSNSTFVSVISNHQNQIKSAEAFNTRRTSDVRQSQIGVKVYSEQTKLNTQPNSQYITCMNGNISALSINKNCPSTSNKNEASDLPHFTDTCLITSDICKKQTINSNTLSGETLVTDIQSSTQLTDIISPSISCTSTMENPLHVDTTGSSRGITNVDRPIVSTLNVKKVTGKCHRSSKAIHQVESRTKQMPCVNTKPVQNVSVTTINEKQVENLQQSLSKPQERSVENTTESQCSDQFGLTQNLLTQSEQGSFIFGIKRIWSHSASEFIPNYQLPEDFWKNKAASIPKDLLEALENW